jgi:hypothetical protein
LKPGDLTQPGISRSSQSPVNRRDGADRQSDRAAKQAIIADMGVKLERAFNASAEFWMILQSGGICSG